MVLRTNKRLVVIGVLACATALSWIGQAQTAGTTPTDPQIVGIVATANQIDIDHAKLALSKSKNKEVREFAQQMATDHEALQKSMSDLGAKLNVTPADSNTSKSLKEQAQQTTEKLNGLSGRAFDKAYIDDEVTYHQAVINAASSVLIPNAQNAELKSSL